MPSWQARASGECIFCTFKHLLSRLPETCTASRLRSSFDLQRTFTSQRTLTRAQVRSGDKGLPTPGIRPEFNNAENRVESRKRQSKDEPALVGIEREDGKGFRGKKTFVFSADGLPRRGTRFEDVGAAILSQLKALEYAHDGTTSGEVLPSRIAALDPERKSWESFKTDVKMLIDMAVKRETRKALSAEQLRFWRRLWEAQMPRHDSNLIPRAEVSRVLEYAFLDHILSRKNQSGSVLYDPAEEYTDLRYPTEWYARTRTTQRQIHLHVGPTNSGKTYNALKRLEESGDGFYCGPLRLLAHEVYARFQAKNIPCHLITGDDVRQDPAERVKLRSSTVEMVDTNNAVEVAVIDEIQMMAHEERGWAWTRAFLGANAKEVHLCGETRVVPLIRELAASMGDTLQIHNYERLSPLEVMSKSLNGNLKLLRKGDCVVSFSILGIHALKKEIEKKTGRRVAIVYGSLPPETRTTQAELFNDPDNDYDFLVASDAIGMGLNLAIKRIIFETVYQFNGKVQEVLSIPQIKQIAGRAGRFRTAKQGVADEQNAKDGKLAAMPQAVGLVTCMEDVDLPIIQKALRTEAESIKAAGLLPPAEFVQEFATRLPQGLPFEYIFRRICDVAKVHPRFMLSDVSQQLNVARVLDNVSDLRIADRLIFAASPADTRKPGNVALLDAMGRLVAKGKPVTCVDIPEIQLEVLDQPMSGQREYLQGLEMLHKSLVLYLWLSYRFVAIFKDQAQAMHAKYLTEQRINETLLKFSHVAELKERLREMKLRQLKESQILAELDPAMPDGEDIPVLFEKEPTLTDTPIEPPSLSLSNEGEHLGAGTANMVQPWASFEEAGVQTTETVVMSRNPSEEPEVDNVELPEPSDVPAVQNTDPLHHPKQLKNPKSGEEERPVELELHLEKIDRHEEPQTAVARNS